MYTFISWDSTLEQTKLKVHLRKSPIFSASVQINMDNYNTKDYLTITITEEVLKEIISLYGGQKE